MRVLLVDDEPSFLEQAKIFLEAYNGLSIKTTTSPEIALDILGSDDDFDAVVSDYKMPKMDGLEFLQTLRKMGNDAPFVMLTGRGDRSVAERALKIGSRIYMRKSMNFQFEALADALIKIGEDKEKEGSKDHLIAWIEKKACAGAAEAKRDLRDLSLEVGFRITRFEVLKIPFVSSSNYIVEAHTDSYSKIPEYIASKVRDWKEMLYWDRMTVDFDVRIEGKKEREKTGILKEVKAAAMV